jgi:hypothetical protein
MTREKLDKILKKLGFEKTEDIYIPTYGEDFYKIYSYDYEVEVEPNKTISPLGYQAHITNKGVEKIMEIYFSVEGSEIAHHVDVYRVIKCRMYIIHVFVGFDDKYFFVHVWDKNELDEIATIEVHGGYLFVGSQTDLDTLLPKLIKALNPHIIRVY